MLKELDRGGIKATFFVQARRAVSMPDQIEQMVKSGHEVGFHCLEHTRHSAMNEEQIEADVTDGLDLLEFVGVRPKAWRTPWGIVTDATRRVADRHGLELHGWTLDTHDWRGDSAAVMFDSITQGKGLVDGDVILMHDGIGPGARREGSDQTLKLTTRLIELTSGLGIETGSVSQVALA